MGITRTGAYLSILERGKAHRRPLTEIVDLVESWERVNLLNLSTDSVRPLNSRRHSHDIILRVSSSKTKLSSINVQGSELL